MESGLRLFAFDGEGGGEGGEGGEDGGEDGGEGEGEAGAGVRVHHIPGTVSPQAVSGD